MCYFNQSWKKEIKRQRIKRNAAYKLTSRYFNQQSLKFMFGKWKTMMAIVHARGVARVYEESIEAALETKYQIIDKLEDQVDELNDLEAEHSVRLAQLEKGIEPYVLKNESLQESLKNFTSCDVVLLRKFAASETSNP